MKNYLYILLWLIYFLFYVLYKDNNFVVENIYYIKYSKEIISYVNGVLSIFLTLWLIWILNNKILELFDSYFSKNNNKYSKILWESITKFFNIFKYIIAVYICIKIAIIPAEYNLIIWKLFKVSFIFIALILWTSVIKTVFRILVKNSKGSDLSKQVFPLLSNILVIFIWIIGLLTIFGNLWYDISALITWAWIWWLALALAAQKSVSNIFWAISILINRPFKVWEFVRINWFVWTVKNIWLTYLELKDATWNKILMPNENLISSAIENLTQRENRKTDINIWVVYETSIEKLKTWIKIIEDILEKEKEKWEIESYRVVFDNFWDFSLNITTTYFSLLNDDYTQYMKQKENINFEIKSLFEKENISMAFPTQEIIVRK